MVSFYCRCWMLLILLIFECVGFFGFDIIVLVKDVVMGLLRFFGEVLLYMIMDEIRFIVFVDFEVSLRIIWLSVSKIGFKEYEDWVIEFGERGG